MDDYGNLVFEPDGNILVEFTLMLKIMREVNQGSPPNYDPYTCRVLENLPLECLDIASAQTLGHPYLGNDHSDHSLDTIFDYSSFSGLSDTLNLTDWDRQYLFGGPSQCHHKVVGDGAINSFDVALLAYYQFEQPPYDGSRLSRVPAEVYTGAGRNDTGNRCGTGVTREGWHLFIADDFCHEPEAPWTFQYEIDGEAPGDHSGYSVSMSSDGTRMAVGAPRAETKKKNKNQGLVRVYEWVNKSWTQLGEDLWGEDRWDVSGVSVSLSADGTQVAVGAPRAENSTQYKNQGHVRVYKWAHGNWTQLGEDIWGDNKKDYSGFSVSLSGDGERVAVGANECKYLGNTCEKEGQVRVFKLHGDQWIQMTNGALDGNEGDRFGISVSLDADGSRLAVGATHHDSKTNGQNVGKVEFYSYADDNLGWISQTFRDGQEQGDKMGISVSLSDDGNVCAVGAHRHDNNKGHVRVFKFLGGNLGVWAPQGKDIDGEWEGDQSGLSVSLSGDGKRVAVGAPFNNGTNGDNSGHVRVYEWSDEKWVQQGDDIDGEGPEDNSGRAVSLSYDGGRMVVGAHNNDGNGQNSGHVRTYKLNPNAPDFQGRMLQAEPAVDEVSVSGIVQVCDWAVVPGQGRWVRISTPTVMINLEFYLAGLAVEEGIQLSNEKTPRFSCTDCAPTLTPTDEVTVTFARFLEYEGVDTLRASEGCADIVGTTPLSALTKNVLSLRQQPATKACRFDMFVWIPQQPITGVHIAANEDPGSYGHTQLVNLGAITLDGSGCGNNFGVLPGSTAMDALSGWVQRETSCEQQCFDVTDLKPLVVPPPSPPPPPKNPSPEPPTPPPTPTPVGTLAPKVEVTLTASGSVSDYSDTSSLQQKIATAAGVAKSLVSISVAPASVITTASASVIITATIKVPASTTAAAVQSALSSRLGTVAAASTALGVTVESLPAIEIKEPGSAEDEATSPLNNNQGSSGAPAATEIMFVVGALVGLAMFLLMAYGGFKVWVKHNNDRPQMGRVGVRGGTISSADDDKPVSVAVQWVKNSAVGRSYSPGEANRRNLRNSPDAARGRNSPRNGRRSSQVQMSEVS